MLWMKSLTIQLLYCQGSDWSFADATSVYFDTSITANAYNPPASSEMDSRKEMETEPSRKKRRLDVPMAPTMTAQLSVSSANLGQSSASPARATEASPSVFATLTDNPAPLMSLDRSISPPKDSWSRHVFQAGKSPDLLPAPRSEEVSRSASIMISSPVQLTRIRDLNASNNVDTVGLGEILGDPLIRECWQFNYLFDVDFLM